VPVQIARKSRDLEADLAICEAATPGPWAVCGRYVVRDKYELGNYRQAVFKAEHIPKIEADMRFAVEAREGWPYAIRRALAAEAEIDRLRNEIQILQEQLEQCSHR
jgi:hypothetical protein